MAMFSGGRKHWIWTPDIYLLYESLCHCPSYFSQSNEITFIEISTFSLVKRKYIWNYKFNNFSSSEADHNEGASALQFKTDGAVLFLFRFSFENDTSIEYQ